MGGFIPRGIFNHNFMIQVNLSNMLFGGFVIEAIDFPGQLPSSVLKDTLGSKAHTQNCECGVSSIC